MSTEITNNSVDASDDVNLDDFSAEFFGQKEAEPEQASPEVNKEDTPDEDAPLEDAHEDEADALAPDDEDEAEEEAPKPKKNRLQERIDKLVGEREDERRRNADLVARLERLENKTTEPEPKTTSPVDTSGPDPEAKNEDGTDKYPLGEFDKNYIRDLTKYAVAEAQKAAREEAKQEEEQAKARTEIDTLHAGWQEKLGPAQERYPDFQEKGLELTDTFENIDAAYGDYLTQTIMSMDYGPDVLYYLANNIDEAEAIVKSGARKATIALGRLEAKFAYANEEKQRARPKVSKAPAPPEHLNKGSGVAIADVPDDTDDLDLFEKKFYASKKRY